MEFITPLVMCAGMAFIGYQFGYSTRKEEEFERKAKECLGRRKENRPIIKPVKLSTILTEAAKKCGHSCKAC